MNRIIEKKKKNLCDIVDAKAVKELIHRVTGSNVYADAFSIRKIESKTEGYDCYSVFDEGDKIIIEANGGVAACVAFNEYLRRVCKCCYTSLTSHMELPAFPPKVGERIDEESKFLYRYCMNYVTYAYTCLYYSWEEYERLTDWMLLSGFNLILNPVGFEIVWRDFLMEIGYSEAEAVANITDPAHMPWQWMGNMSVYGPNLSAWWFEEQKELGRKLTEKIRAFGGDVIYPGFCGKLPVDIKAKYPLAKIHVQNDWCAAGERPPVIDCDDALFSEFAKKFYAVSEKHFGKAGYYAGDPFHEGGVTDNIRLGVFVRKMIDCVQDFSPDAVWFFQGWSGNPRASCFEDLKDDEVITAFLSADRFYKDFTGFGGKPWLYCSLFAFGGNLKMMGNLQGTLQQAYDALADEKMIGTGVAIESIELDEILFDAAAYTSIRKEKPGFDEFIEQYCAARYGYVNDNIRKVHQWLGDHVYKLQEERYFVCSKVSGLLSIPDLKTHKVGYYESDDDIQYDRARFREQLMLLLGEYDTLKDNECYRFDLMHLCRQANADISWEMIRSLERAYEDKNMTDFEAYSVIFLRLFDIQDKLMANCRRTMLGTWLNLAKKRGKTESERRMFVHTVKDLVTLWCGSRGRFALRDYSAREWSGLIKQYHKRRWSAYLSMLITHHDKPLELHSVDWTEDSYVYTFSDEEYPLEPQDTLYACVKDSENLWEEYFRLCGDKKTV